MKRQFLQVITPVLTAAIAASFMTVTANAAKSGISQTKCILSKGDQVDLDIGGENERSGSYTVSNEQIASVKNNGMVTAKKNRKDDGHMDKRRCEIFMCHPGSKSTENK